MRPLSLIRRWSRRVLPGRSSVDDNFIGFDKYRRHGAYHWTEVETNQDYRQKVELLATVLGPTSTCLDLGCGDAAYLGQLAPRCASAVGVDADVDAVRLGRSQLRRRRIDNATCLQLPLSGVSRATLNAPDGFDLVYSMDVIEHLPDPTELIRVAAAAVSPSGTVVIGTPLFLGKELMSPYHVHEFSHDEIHSLLATDLDVVEERLLPERRLDGEVHTESFYVAICRPGDA